METFIECIPATGEDGEWACFVCGQPGEKDCLRESHLATDENIDRLAYLYQAVGPDEFPFGYYRALAESHVFGREEPEE